MGVLRYTFLYVITHSNIHVLELTVELQICVPPSLQHIAVQRSALRSTMQNITDTKDHRTDKAKRLVLNCPGVQGADYTSNTTCLSLGYTHTSIYPFHFATPKQLHNSARLYLPGRGTKHKKTTCDSGSMRTSLEKRCEGNVCLRNKLFRTQRSIVWRWQYISSVFRFHKVILCSAGSPHFLKAGENGLRHSVTCANIMIIT